MNDTIRPTALRLLRSTRNSFATTTAMKDAPATHTGRRARRTPATIPDSAINAHRIDSEVCNSVDATSASTSQAMSLQWLTVLAVSSVARTVPARASPCVHRRSTSSGNGRSHSASARLLQPSVTARCSPRSTPSGLSTGTKGSGDGSPSEMTASTSTATASTMSIGPVQIAT